MEKLFVPWVDGVTDSNYIGSDNLAMRDKYRAMPEPPTKRSQMSKCVIYALYIMQIESNLQYKLQTLTGEKA